DQRGITGLETAIILIAFVVVASVFAFTVLSTGIFSSERSKETVYAGLEEARSTLEPRGSVIAYRGMVSSTATIYKVSFLVSNAVGGEPVNLTPPYTADGSATDPDIVASAQYRTVVSFADDNQLLNDLPWSVTYVGYNNSDSMLDAGEKAEITVWLLDRNNATAIGDADSIGYMDGATPGGDGGMTASATVLTTNAEFTLEVKPESGAVLNIQRTLPAVFHPIMDLK
ncbi:MAG: archaellin/type IV pilin N-terminal domain-containing protein, partial [Dehalococcoidia bacterium]